jgi:hypothetical protein
VPQEPPITETTPTPPAKICPFANDPNVLAKPDPENGAIGISSIAIPAAFFKLNLPKEEYEGRSSLCRHDMALSPAYPRCHTCAKPPMGKPGRLLMCFCHQSGSLLLRRPQRLRRRKWKAGEDFFTLLAATTRSVHFTDLRTGAPPFCGR